MESHTQSYIACIKLRTFEGSAFYKLKKINDNILGSPQVREDYTIYLILTRPFCVLSRIPCNLSCLYLKTGLKHTPISLCVYSHSLLMKVMF